MDESIYPWIKTDDGRLINLDNVVEVTRQGPQVVAYTSRSVAAHALTPHGNSDEELAEQTMARVEAVLRTPMLTALVDGDPSLRQ